MFCPKCAAEVDGAKFLPLLWGQRKLDPASACGQVTQTPEGNLEEGRRRRHGRREQSLDHAFKNVFMGVAFLLVAIRVSLFTDGTGWWSGCYTKLSPMMGTGRASNR